MGSVVGSGVVAAMNDKQFLQWIHDRKHSEDRDVDYMDRFQQIIDCMSDTGPITPDPSTCLRDAGGRMTIRDMVIVLGTLQRYGRVTIIDQAAVERENDWHQLELAIIAAHERRVD